LAPQTGQERATATALIPDAAIQPQRTIFFFLIHYPSKTLARLRKISPDSHSFTHLTHLTFLTHLTPITPRLRSLW
jgi:hypothetical protein